jgi:outer membrane receptor protein involved in Fe transport
MTRFSRLGFLGLTWLVLALAVPAAAQDFRGRITGTVKDTSGGVLPGVTVTAQSPALIQPQVTVTGEDGQYRFIALPPGVYDIQFDLAGFKTLRRADIRVVINTTLTVNADLDVATLQETVTVSGESPIVDTTSTNVGTNFTKELLTDIPNARDVWAAMAQAPGFQMTGYDVGGSHTGTQTGYITYGVDTQNTTRIEGVNTTEGTSANAGYFDFGSFEEFQLGGAGNLADQDTIGASLNITVKSGGDQFHGTWYSDWEGRNLISDNVPANLKVSRQPDADGFFVRAPLERGNPIDRQYDLNGDVGGPVKRSKAWFYYSYRLNDQYKFVLNFDELARSKLSNQYTFKVTYALTKNNQIIGYANKREKLQALRDLSPNIPISAAYFQSSRNYPMKLEWTSVLNDRMFLSVIGAQWLNIFPLRPTTESGAFSGTYVPGRVDISTSARFDGGPNIAYQEQKRNKPQLNVKLNYYKDNWKGSHSLTFGSESRWEKRSFFADQPFNHVYYDAVLGVTPREIEFYNTPNTSDNRTNATALYVNDVWRLNEHVTLNLGLRYDHYRDFWPDQTVNPEGVPQLAGATDARLLDLFAPKQVQAQTVSKASTLAPRFGVAYDPGGDGRFVVKGFVGLFYFNSAPDTIAAQANPVGRTRLRYRFNDLNGNLLIDGPAELGTFLRTAAGPAGVTIDPDLERPYGSEASLHVERELRQGLSGRVSYVYKNIRNEWSTVDLNRIGTYTTPVTVFDPGPDGVRNTADDAGNIQVLDRSGAVAENLVFTNPADPAFDSDYHTVELALNRRFRDRWMMLTSFGYTWLNDIYDNTSSTSSLGAAGNSRSYDWRPNVRRFGSEQTTIWNYKLLGRYVLPFDIGVGGSYKLQSGRQWGRSLAVTLPVAGSETIRVEPVDANRAPSVGIVDLRIDKSFRFPKGQRVTGYIDVFNALNANPPITFRTATATNGSFKEITALLDPRILRLGIRYEF